MSPTLSFVVLLIFIAFPHLCCYDSLTASDEGHRQSVLTSFQQEDVQTDGC